MAFIWGQVHAFGRDEIKKYSIEDDCSVYIAVLINSFSILEALYLLCRIQTILYKHALNCLLLAISAPMSTA